MLRSFTHHGHRSPLPLIEGLEDRKHLSATLKGGLLTIEGTKSNDIINIVRDKKKTQNLLVQINKKRTLAFKLRKINSILVNAGSGNDTVTLNEKRGALTRATLNGGPGNDVLSSGKANDRLDGGDGNDTLKDAGGNNTLIGGAGDDIIYGHNGDDHLDGGAGDDQIAAKGGTDFLTGGDGNDKLEGGDGDDWVYGDAGDDTVRGQGGDDILGGDNEDVLNFWGENAPAPQKGNDLLEGGDGDDWLLGSKASKRAQFDDDTPGKEIDTGNGLDTMIGGAGADIIDRRGDDILRDKESIDIVPVDRYHNNGIPIPPGNDPYALHTHTWIRVFVDGKKVEIPIGVGEFGVSLIHRHYAQVQPIVGTDNEPDYFHLHTLPEHQFTLKEIFHVAGISFSSRNIGRHIVDENHTMTMRVKKFREPDSAYRPNSQFGEYEIQSTDVDEGHARDIIEVYFTTKGKPPAP